MREGIQLGKIVKSDSHIRYLCQVFGAGEVAAPPRPVDFGFGSFVRVPLRAEWEQPDVATLRSVALPDSDALAPDEDTSMWAVGVIYDTLLVNPAFGTLGPRLSNEAQIELFSPDYLSERAVLVNILLLGMLSAAPRNGHSRSRAGGYSVRHGVPAIAPDLGAVVTTLPESEVRAFHYFADDGAPGHGTAYLHMGYLPHIVAQDNPLLPMAVLSIIERLERMFPANAALLSIVKRNFAWRLKVQTAG
jgi:hypothetical protein